MLKHFTTSIGGRLSPAREHFAALREDCKNRLRRFQADRSSGSRKEMEDFTLVLAAWGIDSVADIPGILRDLRLRCLILALPVLSGVVVAILSRDALAFLTLALVAPPCVFGMLTALWRMSVLKGRAFTSFTSWLLRGLYSNRRNPQ